MVVEAKHAVGQTNSILQLEVEGDLGAEFARRLQHAALGDDFYETIEADDERVVFELLGDRHRQKVVFVDHDFRVSHVQVDQVNVEVRIASRGSRHSHQNRRQTPVAVV